MTQTFPMVFELLQVVLVLALAPAFIGWIRMLRCWLRGRTSAGLLQPYRDLSKLFSKDMVLADNASWIFRFSPYLVFGVMVLMAGIIPILSTELLLTATADVIVLVALFAIARFFLALAGMDVGTAFGGMGSSREMMVASLAEPAILMAIFTVSLIGQSTSLSEIGKVLIDGEFVLRPSMAFALLAFILIFLAETGRIPVDNPVTHLELTMIHEAMILEYSGRHLALMEWAHMIKIFNFAAIGIVLFFPWGISTSADLAQIPITLVFLAVKLGLVGLGMALVELPLAKMRLFRVPEFLGAAFLFATLGMLSYFTME
ncbi:MAG: NADH-quinone oxidoreductase subunit H [Nitrospirota bacterium]